MFKPETPFLTVDVIVELVDRPERPIVLIQRRNPPYGWAIPGGFVDRGERLEQAARREIQEEISLQVRLRALLGVYSDPARDPRMHTCTPVYVGEGRGTPQAADDAKAVGIFSLARLPTELAFDHALILADYRRFRESGLVAPLWEG
ncbi:MAG: NUDIX hydrolase [Magnetococcales bacterium]|nr:NUDIX hydrolase [Magnetococcales bacterium]